MKKTVILLAAGLLTALLLTACGTPASSAAPAPVESTAAPSSTMAPVSESEIPAMEDLVYRGEVIAASDESFEVAQLPGFNYGFESIVYNRTEDTVVGPEGSEIAVGAFVEVTSNGPMTASLPPQTNAMDVTVIATFSDGIIVNGSIEEVTTTDDGYSISITTMASTDAASTAIEPQLIILNVPADALEGLTEEDLVPGAQVSAITTGITATSLPPQMPVHRLLPYLWDVEPQTAAAE